MTTTDFKQTTISKDISLTGVGLHTGNNVTLVFKAAPANHGYKFQRVDLEGQPVIEADATMLQTQNVVPL